MRLAVIADIHGNLPAFEAALEHVDRQQVDRLVILGDIVVGAPDSAACWNLARSLSCPILRGNNDRYVAHYDTPAADPMGRLYLREVATASLQIVPFLRHYRDWAPSLSLDEAVERFLNLY